LDAHARDSAFYKGITMDRYWIAKGNKIKIPSQDEIKQFQSTPKESPLLSKAEICADIIRLMNPKFTDKDVVRHAPALAKLSMEKLLTLRETYRLSTKVKK
jgi:hypothetical protein